MLIRKAFLTDADSIAACLLLAMEDIVYGFIGERDAQKAKAFLRYFAQREHNQYSYQNCWVAEEGKEVVAAVNVYDGAQLQELRQPVVDYIRARFHKDFAPEDETGAGEYYIDSLGVQPQRRGRGTGTALLRFLIDEYVVKQSRILGLLVDEDNPGAKRLYLRLGFERAGKKMLFGKAMEHLQVKG